MQAPPGRRPRALRLERPIIQAPLGAMGPVELVAAVSNAGGLGTLSLTWTESAAAARLIAEVRERTTRPFAANFVLAFEPAALPAALEAGVPIVTFSWGLPGQLVRLAHSSGAGVGVQVGTLEAAQRALAEGCDFLICQGIEAGGHVQSTIPLRTLLPAVVEEARSTPVVAAGGLADGEDVAEVLALGARCAMLGTRFVASQESRAHPAYKRALVAGRRQDAVLTRCFDGGWPHAPHRVLRNSTLTAWEQSGRTKAGSRPGDGEVVARGMAGAPIPRYDYTPPTAEAQGNVLDCCLYAGTGVEKISRIQGAGELVAELSRDALARLTVSGLRRAMH